MEERLQKILASAGLGSRRSCEQLITAGRVRVNGQVAQLGQKADPARDKITFDGRTIEAPEAHIYIALNKPRNALSTVENEPGDNRPNVRGLIPIPGHLYPVGRLDFESEGLMLITNDGALANRLTHPRYEHEKEYRVLVATRPDHKQLEAWQRGIVLEDGYRTKPLKVWIDSLHGKGTWLRVILKEGRKRQIREMGRLTGLPVVRIIRVRIGTLELGNLKPKEWRELTSQEVAVLKGEKTGRPAPSNSSRTPRRTPAKQRTPAKPKQTRTRKPPVKR